MRFFRSVRWLPVVAVVLLLAAAVVVLFRAELGLVLALGAVVFSILSAEEVLRSKR